MFTTKNIILASASPRRQDLLKKLKIPFTIKVKSIDEVFSEELTKEEISNYLAIKKADAFKNELHKNDILITSDTIVWHNNQALGKPKDNIEAKEMLQSLSNKTHQVITSVCLTSTKKQKVFHSLTNVTFKKLTENEINFYITNYKPFDKAGAYGIQEWIGLVAVTKIEGSYFNVMGLPVNKLYEELLKF